MFLLNYCKFYKICCNNFNLRIGKCSFSKNCFIKIHSLVNLNIFVASTKKTVILTYITHYYQNVEPLVQSWQQTVLPKHQTDLFSPSHVFQSQCSSSEGSEAKNKCDESYPRKNNIQSMIVV